ncbi:MAG TPA: hypothetical protein VL588_07915, partial [Bdellovibrionota bacterium]|nr:hypothetical protein [Bdellovibrionota bacterium]
EECTLQAEVMSGEDPLTIPGHMHICMADTPEAVTDHPDEGGPPGVPGQIQPAPSSTSCTAHPIRHLRRAAQAADYVNLVCTSHTREEVEAPGAPWLSCQTSADSGLNGDNNDGLFRHLTCTPYCADGDAPANVPCYRPAPADYYAAAASTTYAGLNSFKKSFSDHVVADPASPFRTHLEELKRSVYAMQTLWSEAHPGAPAWIATVRPEVEALYRRLRILEVQLSTLGRDDKPLTEDRWLAIQEQLDYLANGCAHGNPNPDHPDRCTGTPAERRARGNLAQLMSHLSSSVQATTADGASEFTRRAEDDARRLNAAAATLRPEIDPGHRPGSGSHVTGPVSAFYVGWSDLMVAEGCVTERRRITRERRQAANTCPGVRRVTDADLNPHSPVAPPVGGDSHPVDGERGE